MSDKEFILEEQIKKLESEHDFVELIAILQFSVLKLSKEAPVFLEKIEHQSEIFSKLDTDLIEASKKMSSRLDNIWSSLDKVDSAISLFKEKLQNDSSIKIPSEDYESLVSILEGVSLAVSDLKGNPRNSPAPIPHTATSSSLLKIEENTESILGKLSSSTYSLPHPEISDREDIINVLSSEENTEPPTLQINIFQEDRATLYLIGIISIVSFFVGLGVSVFI